MGAESVLVDNSDDTDVVILAQGLNPNSEWETLSSGDKNGNRTEWWRENATPGYFSDFRTVRRTMRHIVTTEVLDTAH